MTSFARLGLLPTLTLLSSLIMTPSLAQAKATIEFLPSQSAQTLNVQSFAAPAAAQAQIAQAIAKNFDLTRYRNVGVQTITDSSGRMDHLLLHLHSLRTHRLEMASVELNSRNEIIRVQNNYHVQANDLSQQPGVAGACPDAATQFIAFAPNDDALELQITSDVAAAAKAKGLHTIELYKTQATRAAYLAYMSCPKLVGNFYDGDANPDTIVTNDGLIGSSDLANLRFNYHVTNIWLACEAFNDPMLSSVTKDAQSQKYAAGINDLLVGPSDRTAKCTMMAALNGQPMTSSFESCYKTFDSPEDHWGFDGAGADYLGH